MRKSRFLKGAVGVIFVVAVLCVSLVSFRGSMNEPAKPTFVRSYALFGSDSMTISGNTQVYSIGSIADQTEQAEGHIRSNGPITISGSNHINGNATSGPGYSVTITGGKNQVLGTTGSADSALDAQVALSQEWLAYAQQSNNNSSIPSQYLDSYGNLKVTGNKTCTLPAGTYYLNGITLSGSGKVVLEGDAVLATYGTVTLSGNSRLNYNESPSKCLVVSTASSHTFSGSSKGSFELFSPSAAVSITGNYVAIANFWAESITISGSSVSKRLVSAVAPSIQVVSPSDGSFITTETPFVKVVFQDEGGGVDTSSLEITIDNVPIDYLTIDATQAEGTLQTALGQGAHLLRARISNDYGYFSETQSTFTIDSIAPVITVGSPQDGMLTNISAQTIVGTTSEPVTLTMNGTNIPLNESLAFATETTLVEGVNSYVFTAIDLAGNSSSLTLNLSLDSIPPQAIDATKVTVSQAASGVVTITGVSTSAEGNCRITAENTSNPSMPVPVSANPDGSFLLTISGETNDVITLKSADAAGNESPSISVTVPAGGGPGGDLPPDPATVATPIDPTVPTDIFATTAFLYEGETPIQMDVAPGTIQAKRVAVLRGKALDFAGEPVSGIKITILNHQEFGWTLTRVDGMFDMAVNGGGQLVVSYEKEGYLPVQRHLETPWRDYMWAEDVVMTQFDPAMTQIDLQSPLPMQVAQGSPVTDVDGERQAAILFPTGTTAQMVMPDGTTQPLTTAGVRITEYTLGENGPTAMPAALPPQSGYTYCVELSADEAIAAKAASVQFSQPLIYYVNNFIGFPVGTPVPLGFYDRLAGVWKAEENGLVVKILGYDGGIALLDVTGTGVVADALTLATLGITDEERANIALLYPVAGTELWREKINHFSSWDSNWPYWADGGTPPDVDPPVKHVTSTTCSSSGSIIGIQNQSLGEAFGLVGLPFTICYQSLRAGDYASEYSLDIQLSKSTLPSTLKRIDLVVEIAGQVHNISYPAASNLNHLFKWDNKDGYGRLHSGTAKATVKVGWVFPVVYKSAAEGAASFAQASAAGINISGSRKTSEMTLAKVFTCELGNVAESAGPLGGWSLEPHNVYDIEGRKIFFGNGTVMDASEADARTISRIAGGGNYAPGGQYEGYPATQLSLNRPFGLGLAPDGTVYAACNYQARVFKISPDGKLYTFAGTGTGGDSGDGGPSTGAQFKNPFDVSVGPDGSVYIADSHAYKIRKVLPDGIITTFAGNGLSTFSGDGGAATQAGLVSPVAVEASGDGSVYICQSDGRIRRVTPDGRIETYAGGGTILPSNPSFDGSMATEVNLGTVRRMAITPDGSLIIPAASLVGRVYKVTTDGRVHFFAGTGVSGHSGDGGAATEAKLKNTYAAAVDNVNSGVYLSDDTYIRYVDSSGIITTVAGINASGSTGDGGSPLQAALMDSYDMVFDKENHLIISSTDRVRKILSTMAGFSASEIFVPSEDGSVIFRFSPQGRHLQTLNALTGAPIWTFAYDGEGRLVSITDAYNSTATIERDGNGNPTAIVSPYGQRTTFTTNPDGFLSSISFPDNTSMSFTYSDGGLLETFTDARGQVHTFTYDENGRLINDADPAGGAKSLQMTEVTGGWSVTVTTAEGHSKTYTITDIASGGERRTSIDSGCTTCSTTSVILPNGTTTVTSG
ncbi:MAG TPA: hypothetical protein PKJ37_08470, partial [Acidobacteriota bacterium]|nr:hypothetical protein [Acidobacteriota bacterium]HNT17909.1 hypothetical protein [Acidobacteriota bacterium]